MHIEREKMKIKWLKTIDRIYLWNIIKNLNAQSDTLKTHNASHMFVMCIFIKSMSKGFLILSEWHMTASY